MGYKPIENYGVIGDMHSVALVGMDGSIDWCCLPNFDSPSIFAAILDERKGGYFKIASTAEGQRRQMYLPETNVLVTRFLSTDGVGEVIDFMPMQPGQAVRHDIVRIVRGVRGSVPFRMECLPAFDYARTGHQLTMCNNGAVFTGPGCKLGLLATIAMHPDGDGVVAEFTLNANESAVFVLEHVEDEFGQAFEDPEQFGEQSLRATINVWKEWVSRCQYRGRWREMVIRSALALKMLTFEPTGAIVAAATTSLPEEIGGVRNWDYRYTWIRDAAFTIYAFLTLGYTSEAAQFMKWLHERTTEDDDEQGPLQVMYAIDGRHELTERSLDHLEGYKGSRPVRIGNAACKQLQLDIYGALVDAIYLYNKHGDYISYQLWSYLRPILDWVAANWERPDHGIWEIRSEPRHFVYSKVQCWVALNRGLRIAEKRGLPVDYARYRQQSNRIYESIMQKGWDAEHKTFVQYFGSTAVDASNLLLPLMLFLSPTDPMMQSTLDAIMRELASDILVHRYKPGKAAGDGLPGTEGTFSVCTFWLVEAMARAGRVEEARLMFEKMLTYANHLGLYAEEIGLTGEALGNFPQAFTHLGLISAALALDRHLDIHSRP